MEFKDLTQEQKQIVTAPIGNLKTVAVAGSGKTNCLSFRVKQLVDKYDVKPSEILMLTFSNKAAKEMTKRVSYLLPDQNFTSETFHSFGSKLTQKYHKELGLSKKFKILNQQDKKSLMELSRKRVLSSNKVRAVPKYNVLLEMYSGSLNHNMKFEEYAKKFYKITKPDVIDVIKLIFKEYIIQKQNNSFVDFDDLLLNTYDLLNDNRIRRQINKQYKHIIIDEFQDINFIQNEIIKKLNGNNSLFVIGDSNQCIYEWRGSDDKFIDSFEQDYPNAKVFHLTTNFRSTQEILDLAEDSINNNRPKEEVKLIAESEGGFKPIIFSAADPTDAYETTANDIVSNYSSELQNVAVLLRFNADCSDAKQIFDKMGIPAVIDKTKSLTSTKHFKDIKSLLAFIDDPNKDTIQPVLSNFGIIKSQQQDLIDYLKKINFNFSKFDYKNNVKVADIFRLIISLFFTKDNSISKNIELFYETFYKDNIIKNRTNHEQIFEDIERIIKQSKNFDDFNEFSNYYTINDDEEVSTRFTPSVKIMTLHKSKGLEFPHVYILGLNNGILPQSLTDEEVINERKLFYVGCTRAMNDLMICYYENDVDGEPLNPSIFIDELNEGVYDMG